MSRREVKALLAVLSVSIVMLLPVSGLARQEKDRLVDKESWKTEPVKIDKVKVKNRAVELGETFTEEDDWLRGLTVSLKNTSGKEIVYVEMELMFPRPGGGTEQTPVYLYRLFYGQQPSTENPPAPDERKRLKPGESVDVSLPEGEEEHIKAVLAHLGYPAETKHARFGVGVVVFGDGTMWRAGRTLNRSPNDPDTWKTT